MNKKYLAILCVSMIASAVITAFASTSAIAQSSRLYFAGYMGLNTHHDLEFSDSVSNTSGDLEMSHGYSFAGALGLRLSDKIRTEAEISYRKSDFDRVDFGGGSSFKTGGELTTWLGMINVYYDFDVPWRIRPFVGAGVGVAFSDGEINDGSNLASNASDEDYGLAWQLGGGLKYRLSDDAAITGGYRFVDTMDMGFNGYEIDYGSHEFRMGLEWDLPY